jgi:hypothetical protein
MLPLDHALQSGEDVLKGGPTFSAQKTASKQQKATRNTHVSTARHHDDACSRLYMLDV